MPCQLSGLLKNPNNANNANFLGCGFTEKGVRLLKNPYLPAQVRPGAREPIRAARFRLEAACWRTEPAPPLRSSQEGTSEEA